MIILCKKCLFRLTPYCAYNEMMYTTVLFFYFNFFQRQELDRMQCVIRQVNESLCDLKLAIDGTIVMSQYLRESLDAMYDARIPEKWMKVCRFRVVLRSESFILAFRYHGNRPRSVFGIPNCWSEIHSFGSGL